MVDIILADKFVSIYPNYHIQLVNLIIQYTFIVDWEMLKVWFCETVKDFVKYHSIWGEVRWQE